MSKKHRIAITELGMPRDRLPEDIVACCDPILGSGIGRLEECDLIALVQDADALLFSSRDPVTRPVLEAANRLRIAIKFGAKPTNINFEAAAEQGVAVGWTPGANTRSVAEYTLLMALAALRRVDRALDTVAGGGWRGAEHIGTELEGKVVGIIGLGGIGQTVARMFAALDANVLAYDPYRSDEVFAKVGAERAPLEELMRRADVITLHCELTSETRDLMDRRAFELMKPAAVLVNTARGALIDEQALCDSLESGRLAAAALDVFTTEPLPQDHPYKKTPGLIATPHVAARSLEAIEKERFWALRDAIAYLEDRPVERIHITPAGELRRRST